MNMKQVKKAYRLEHGVLMPCPVCKGREGIRKLKRCCLRGTLLGYADTSPGLRAFARSFGIGKSPPHTGKLAQIVGA